MKTINYPRRNKSISLKTKLVTIYSLFLEIPDKSQLDKSTIYFHDDGSIRETNELKMVYELVDEKQKKVNKLF